MKEHLRELVQQALMDLRRERQWPIPLDQPVSIEPTRRKAHGDYACNVALLLAKPLGRAPLEVAEAIRSSMLPSRHVAEVSTAAPGFVNFRMSATCRHGVVRRILEARQHFGEDEPSESECIHVEFVSANPTGPLKLGHGRGAAFGASLCALLAARGARVQREYYVNDVGQAVDILALAVWLRYLELIGQGLPWPQAAPAGEHIYAIARELKQIEGDRYRRNPFEIQAGLPPDGSGEQGEVHLQALLQRAREMLGADFVRLRDAGLEVSLKAIQAELAAFGVGFDRWVSERELARCGRVEQAIERLRANGHLYPGEDGKLWFAAAALGDEADRVLLRADGRPTYLASDIAYLLDKFERGCDRAIYVLAADHHAYVARLQAAARGLAIDPERVECLLVQPASLRGEGDATLQSDGSLHSLRERVGSETCRFFFVMHDHRQPLDFDLGLAQQQHGDNPLHYLQYACARISAVFRGLEERHLSHNLSAGDAARGRLQHPAELELMGVLMHYPELIEKAAELRAPHLLANYLRELAHALHGYYDHHDAAAVRVLCEEDELRNARLSLLKATRQVLANGLLLLGVTPAERL